MSHARITETTPEQSQEFQRLMTLHHPGLLRPEQAPPPPIDLTETVDSLLADCPPPIYADPIEPEERGDDHDQGVMQTGDNPPFSAMEAADLEEQEERLQQAARLKTLSVPDLRATLERNMEQDGMGLGLLAAQEFTARGVPPMCRGLRLIRRNLSGPTLHALLAYDLEWIATTYPEKVEFTKKRSTRASHYRAIFTKRRFSFLSGVEHIAERSTNSAGELETWRIATELDLTEGEQMECLIVHGSTVGKRKAEIYRKEGLMRTHILQKAIEAGKQAGQLQAGVDATVERRMSFWFCSMIIGRSSPTKIAKMHQRMTGDGVVDRSTVAAQLEKIPTRLPRKAT